MIKTCWFLCVSPLSSRMAALQKYCTQPCLPKKVEGRPRGRPSLKGKLWIPEDNNTGSAPATNIFSSVFGWLYFASPPHLYLVHQAASAWNLYSSLCLSHSLLFWTSWPLLLRPRGNKGLKGEKRGDRKLFDLRNICRCLIRCILYSMRTPSLKFNGAIAHNLMSVCLWFYFKKCILKLYVGERPTLLAYTTRQ